MLLHRRALAGSALGLSAAALIAPCARAQAEDGTIPIQVASRDEDYRRARRRFRTELTRRGRSPQTADPVTPPDGVRAETFRSGALALTAWVGLPAQTRSRMPAVIFLHGGFAFGVEDWQMAAPYLEAGFVVIAPMLRGENGQAGVYSLFYDEVDDVIAAAAFARSQHFIDRDHIYLAGHSVGGTLALLAAEAAPGFRAVASFSGSPDQAIYCQYGINERDIPFDVTNAREIEMRSPLSYAASFRAPVRAYFGTREPHFRLSTLRMAEIARAHGKDVQAMEIEGGHMSAVPRAMWESIRFFLERW